MTNTSHSWSGAGALSPRKCRCTTRSVRVDESANGEELMCCVNKNSPMSLHLNETCKSSHVGTGALHTNFALRLEDGERGKMLEQHYFHASCAEAIAPLARHHQTRFDRSAGDVIKLPIFLRGPPSDHRTRSKTAHTQSSRSQHTHAHIHTQPHTTPTKHTTTTITTTTTTLSNFFCLGVG